MFEFSTFFFMFYGPHTYGCELFVWNSWKRQISLFFEMKTCSKATIPVLNKNSLPLIINTKFFRKFAKLNYIHCKEIIDIYTELVLNYLQVNDQGCSFTPSFPISAIKNRVIKVSFSNGIERSMECVRPWPYIKLFLFFATLCVMGDTKYKILRLKKRNQLMLNLV